MMSSTFTLTENKAEYARRPADERFSSLASMVSAAEHDKALSVDKSYNWRDLRFQEDGARVVLASPRGAADFSHWAFGQAARSLESPAAYLRDKLSPALAADVLNYRVTQAPHGQDARLLLRAPNGNGRDRPLVRACTSDSYARIWDADLYGSIGDVFARDAAWGLPFDTKGERCGAYRGDRDSFLIYINERAVIEDPSAPPGEGGMSRGVLVRNSEVGGGSVVLDCLYFRSYCRNQLLFGVVMDTQFRRRHVGDKVLRDTVREISSIGWRWVESSAARDEAIIRQLIDREIARTREGVADELRRLGATKEQAEASILACERSEASSPRSFWGVAQGVTRVSQLTDYQDERLALDSLASKLLAKGRKLVAA